MLNRTATIDMLVLMVAPMETVMNMRPQSAKNVDRVGIGGHIGA